MAIIDDGGGGGGGSSDDDGLRFLEAATGIDPTQATRRGISGVLLAFFGGLALIINTFFAGVADFVVGVVDRIGTFVGALFSGPQEILEISGQASALATQQFGIAAFPVGVVIVIIAFTIWDASDVELPFLDRFNFRGRD